jgi:hypothetical protein
VYQAAEELQKELTMTADTYKAALKLFARLKATTQTARQERIVSNMKIAFVEFIQDKQPEINWLKIVRVPCRVCGVCAVCVVADVSVCAVCVCGEQKLQSMFVCQASYLFLVLCQLLWEIRKRQSLWLKLGKYCLATIQVMQSELSSLVISFHKDWVEHKQRIEVPHTHYRTRDTRAKMCLCVCCVCRVAGNYNGVQQAEGGEEQGAHERVAGTEHGPRGRGPAAQLRADRARVREAGRVQPGRDRPARNQGGPRRARRQPRPRTRQVPLVTDYATLYLFKYILLSTFTRPDCSSCAK